MSMRGPKDGGVKGADVNTQVVDKAATAGQKSAVFHAFDRTADP
jgi:hypothetical protein